MSLAFHTAGFALMLLLWCGFYSGWLQRGDVDFSRVPHPGEYWRIWLRLVTLVGIAWILLAYREG